jgi:hypothetical protein
VIGRDCAVCGWASRDGLELPGWCARCRGRTVADVADLPELFATLAHLLTPGATGDGERVGGSRTPPLPLRVDVANLRGPAQAGTLAGPDQHGPLSIATVLWLFRQAIRDAAGLPADLTSLSATDTATRVDADARFVAAWADRYAELAPPGELAHWAGLIHDTRRAAWQACGYTAHKTRLGPCPQQIEPGLSCGNELWIDAVLDDSVTCRDCGSRWDRKYFLWLKRHGQEGI